MIALDHVTITIWWSPPSLPGLQVETRKLSNNNNCLLAAKYTSIEG